MLYRSLNCACFALALGLMGACGGSEDTPPAQGMISTGDAADDDGFFPDASAEDGSVAADGSGDDAAAPVDVAQEVGPEVEAGPPPECTEETSWKCEDGIICTEDSCVDGDCVNAPIEDCCTVDTDCDDGVPCTIDECNPTKSECLNSFETNTCCITTDDCAEADSCQEATCAGHQCVYTVKSSWEGCACENNLDCGDGSACTDDLCEDGACIYTLSGADGCCLVDADCDDGDAGTVDQCQAGLCYSGTLACQADGDCAGPNACGTGSCIEGTCTYEEDCCLLDSSCADGHTATGDLCVEGTCVNPMGPSAACTADGDCAKADNPCALGTCVTSVATCSYGPAGGAGCCATDADCQGADACSSYACVDFQCVETEGAGAVAHWSATWDDGTLGGWTVEGDGKAATWQVVDFQATSPPNSLYYGQLPQKNYDVGHTQGTVTSPSIVVPEDLTGVYLTFSRNVDTEPYVTTDLFRLELFGQGGWEEIWNKNVDGGPGVGWATETIPLVITSNATTQIRFVFDSVDDTNNDTMGVLVDDVMMMKPCP